jgi:hypothetical protein
MYGMARRQTAHTSAHPITEAGHAFIAKSRCTIHSIDLLAGTTFSNNFAKLAVSTWPGDPYSAELWMQRYLADGHPWLTDNATEADVTLLQSNLSLACRKWKQFGVSHAWMEAVWRRHAGAADSKTRGAVMGTEWLRGHHRRKLPPQTTKFERVWPAYPDANGPQLALIYTCDIYPPWWRSPWTANSLLALRWAKGPFSGSDLDLVIPACINEATGGGAAPWLAGTAAAPLLPLYRARRLLFFAGHTPKLYISRFRFDLWTQLRRAQLGAYGGQITLDSGDLDCMIGTFEICTSDSAIEANHTSFCRERCAAESRHQGHVPTRTCMRSAEELRRTCRSYRGVDWELVHAAPARAVGLGGRISVGSFLGKGLAHRFCVASPGDLLYTPKTSEAVALAAAGGCVPLLVLPDSPFGITFSDARSNKTRLPPGLFSEKRGRRMLQYPELLAKWEALPESTRRHVSFAQWAWLHHAMGASLPYIRWLDWCEFALILPASLALSHTTEVLAALSAISEKRFGRMAAAALAARPAFVYSARRRGEELAAQDFVLAELCAHAAHVKRFNISTRGNNRLAEIQNQHNAQGPDERPIHYATRLARCIVTPSSMVATAK